MDLEESSPDAASKTSTPSSISEQKESEQKESEPKSPSTTADGGGEAKAEKLSPTKVDILLKPAGDAPIMKKKKWAVDRSKKIYWVADFIKRFIKSEASESLFLYVNQSFAPSPDTDIGSVFDCFGSDGKLVLHYCKTQAWG